MEAEDCWQVYGTEGWKKNSITVRIINCIKASAGTKHNFGLERGGKLLLKHTA